MVFNYFIPPPASSVGSSNIPSLSFALVNSFGKRVTQHLQHMKKQQRR